jgi:hypothetical protein
MVQRLFRESDSRSAGQETLRILWNYEVQYRVKHNSILSSYLRITSSAFGLHFFHISHTYWHIFLVFTPCSLVFGYLQDYSVSQFRRLQYSCTLHIYIYIFQISHACGYGLSGSVRNEKFRLKFEPRPTKIRNRQTTHFTATFLLKKCLNVRFHH